MMAGMAFVCLLTNVAAMAQPRHNLSEMVQERLNRGVVVVKTSDGRAVVSWRTLKTDRKGEPFDVWRNGVKLTAVPLTTGGTFFVDDHPLATDATYEVRGGQHENTGSFTLKGDAPAGYLPIPLQGYDEEETDEHEESAPSD